MEAQRATQGRHGVDEHGRSYYQLGDKHRVPLALHAENRQRLREAMVAKLVSLIGGSKEAATCGDGHVVLLMGGKETSRHCTDHEPLFRQESYFHWAFGVDVPDFFGAVELGGKGRAVLFAPRLPESYAVWLGAIDSWEELKVRYEVDACYAVDEMAAVLRDTLQATTLHVLKGLNTDSQRESQPAEFDGIAAFPRDFVTLHPVISELRVYKTPLEVEVLRYACKVSSEAHRRVMRAVREGRFEFELESEFLNYCYGHGGCRFVSYTCICATGPNASILHYGHSGNPNACGMRNGDIAYFDMGAEYYCYGSDITVSFPVSGRFTADQKMVYNAVLAAQRAVYAQLKPGVRYADMHTLAYRTILEQLCAGGVLQGSVDDMMARNLGALFMPHGLGHFLGIDTHDVGGYNGGETRSTLPGHRNLRTPRELRAGMYLTNEPGLYFIESLLRPALDDPALAPFFVRERVLPFLDGHFGGVRLEDDVLITENGYEILSDVPRTVEEVEACMADHL